MVARIVCSSRADLRLREASGWLDAHEAGVEVLVVGATFDAAAEQIRSVALKRGAAFGFHRLSLGRLAAELAKLEMAARDLAPIGALPTEALCARVIDRLRREGRLGRLAAVMDQPGLPRALARTLLELRMAGVTIVDGDSELTTALQVFQDELAEAHLADKALVYETATAIAADMSSGHPMLGHDVLFLDVPVRTVAERRLVAALVARARSTLATVPQGDERTLQIVREVMRCDVESVELPALTSSLQRVQRRVFTPNAERADLDDTVAVLSAPGENRECVEIARRVLREAERGVPFDRMAVLLRSPEQHRVHLEEALGRAGIPAYFERGTVLPDPSGRAFLALLACADEKLSARRFGEYLSLGEVPDADPVGTPPPAARSGDRWVPPDEELLRNVLASVPDEEPQVDPAPMVDASVVAGTLRAPWRWERLLLDAAVIGGRERWSRRLDGLESRLRLDDREEGRENRAQRLADLAQFRNFALPLLDDIAALPEYATWGDWLDLLSALATRALRRPDRVLSLLASLAPMREVGPIDLREVQIVLGPRLGDLVTQPSGRRYGRLFVAPIEAARGMCFDVVFAPGLAERMFPQKLVEDPLLLDTTRLRLGLELETSEDRLAQERLALRLALGAACDRVILAYPRIDLDQGRPRVPSFYGLEVLEAAEGTLPDFDDLARRAEVTGAARIGWPAPHNPLDAIDEAEHDLALLDGLLHSRDAATGAAHYLLGSNEHLARALRARARKWEVKSWKPSDGFILSSPPTPEARAALDAHAPTQRSFSPTALQQLAACPYRFVLRTIVRIEPREMPEPVEELGALERGSLIHEVQFELLGELRDAGMLPVRGANLDTVRDCLDVVLDRVSARYHDELWPAIDRVWNDGIASIRADLREWLRRMSEEIEWTPSRFELAFGIDDGEGRDPASIKDPVTLDCGLSLRGSIDLVEERGGLLRATDHKTGLATVAAGTVIGNGKILQPVFYALALEKLFPGATIVGGRLHYCTTRGDFRSVEVPLDGEARIAAHVVAETLTDHFARGFFPAAPAKDECKFCDFRPICGPYEELRIRRKAPEPLIQLGKLRAKR